MTGTIKYYILSIRYKFIVISSILCLRIELNNTFYISNQLFCKGELIVAKMYKKYERMLNSGEYMNENELCNALGLNYDDLYEDESDDDDG